MRLCLDIGCQLQRRKLAPSAVPEEECARKCVQFARSLVSGDEFAIKFYLHQTAFQRERLLYQDATLRVMMPATHAIEDNAPREGHAVERAPNGYVFPPCIIIERGESLDEWARRESPDFITTMQVRLLLLSCELRAGIRRRTRCWTNGVVRSHTPRRLLHCVLHTRLAQAAYWTGKGVPGPRWPTCLLTIDGALEPRGALAQN